MSEQLSQPDRWTDDELIDREISLAEETASEISAACARVIASQYHDGQNSGLYTFVSTGIVDRRMTRELDAMLKDAFEQGDEVAKRRLMSLMSYDFKRIYSGTADLPIDNFSQFWLEQPSVGDRCPCCAEDISRPHREGCPLSVDDEQQLTRVLELQVEHGKPILWWLELVGFRNADELEQVAGMFPDSYYGFYPDLDTFRAAYEMASGTYLDQAYYMVWDDGGVYVYDR